jgi:hypothetical protein
MMLDPIIPSHQFAERHVATLPTLVCRTLWQVEFARSPVIRLLFGISGLARRFRQGRGRMHARLEDCRGGQRHRYSQAGGTGIVVRFGWFYGPGAAHSEQLFGQLRIQLQDGDDVVLGPGELLVIPRGGGASPPGRWRGDPSCALGTPSDG